MLRVMLLPKKIVRLLGAHSASTSSISTLPFGYFLENRASFLQKISEQAKLKSIQEQETRLIDIIEKTGSKTELVTVKYPELFDEGSMIQTSRYSFDLKQMMACSMHLGHSASKWNPKMAPFIFGERQGIHIIELERTLACLRVACQALTDIVSKGGQVLFVGTREPIRRLTYEIAVDSGQFYVNLRWLGGTITNRAHVLRNEGLVPDVLVVFDYPNNEKAINEANKANIPVVAICDTDCDPSQVTYPIPANDDAFASVELIARVLSLAASEGRARRKHQSSVTVKANEFIEKSRKFVKYQ